MKNITGSAACELSIFQISELLSILHAESVRVGQAYSDTGLDSDTRHYLLHRANFIDGIIESVISAKEDILSNA